MNRFGEEWKLFEDMDAPEKPLPPLPPSSPAPKHQRSIETKSKTPTLTNRLERRKRLVKPDKKEANEKSNETKIDPNRKRRRRKRNKVRKSPVNEPETTPTETLNYIWDQVETIGTNVYKYFWPEKFSEGIKQNEKSLPSDMELMHQTCHGAIEFFFTIISRTFIGISYTV